MKLSISAITCFSFCLHGFVKTVAAASWSATSDYGADVGTEGREKAPRILTAAKHKDSNQADSETSLKPPTLPAYIRPLGNSHAPWSTSTWTNSVAICTTMRSENSTDVTEWLLYYRYGGAGLVHVYSCTAFM